MRTDFFVCVQPSKIDVQLETGEYFLNQQQKKEKVASERAQQSEGVRAQKKREREAVFVAPKEKKHKPAESGAPEESSSSKAAAKSALDVQVRNLKEKGVAQHQGHGGAAGLF
jgi:ribosomal RNA assembly protein